LSAGFHFYESGRPSLIAMSERQKNQSALRFLIVAGPTAVGKTDFALEVARRSGTAIVNADAFQMYRGFDVLTAKPSPAQQAIVQHHLLSFLEPAESLDAYRFANLATRKIRELNERGMVPLVVGGNGFYLRALTHVLPALPSADPALRRELEQRPLNSLVAQLKNLDPESFGRIDHHNSRRIIRALEVSLLTGQPFSSFRTSLPRREISALLLQRSRFELVSRISERVRRIFAEGGLQEVAGALQLDTGAARTIGFRAIKDYLEGRQTFAACQEKVRAQTNQYARRQQTWFRAQAFQIADPDNSIALAVDLVRKQQVASETR
jgi:tRNA dimethylallyltransferase